MMREIKKVIKEKLEESKATSFGQHNYDGAKSAKVTNLQLFRSQFVKGNFNKNLVLCLGYKHSDYTTGQSS